jgi:hypothetical protein
MEIFVISGILRTASIAVNATLLMAKTTPKDQK